MKTKALTRKILFEKSNKDIREWLYNYDSGLIVKSVSMGGLGTGYELTIQECAIETMRNLAELELPEDDTEFSKAVMNASDKAADDLDKIHGFSGAQVGASKNIAAVFWKQTPEKGIKSAPPERIIQLQKGKDGMAIIIEK